MARPSVPGGEPPTRWLAFVTQLPIDDAAGRMKVLRTLETLVDAENELAWRLASLRA